MACVVLNCKSHSSKKSKEEQAITFHRFPEDELKNLWVKAIHRSNWEPSQHSRICSKHFSKECYIEGKKRKLLKRNAIPTIFENWPMYKQQESAKLARSHTLKLRRSVSCSQRQTKQVINTELGQASMSNEVCNANYSLIEPSIDDTPREKKLKKALRKQIKLSENRLKKLKSVQQRCRRYKNQICFIQNVLNELKSKPTVNNKSTIIYFID